MVKSQKTPDKTTKKTTKKPGKKSENKFVFATRLHLNELTGISAHSIPELLEYLHEVSGSCIYSHTHHFIQQHQYLSPEPPNDFAYWVSEILGDKSLGERIASIDIMSHSSIRSIREALIAAIEDALKTNPRLQYLTAPEGREFAFLKTISFVFPTPYEASNLREFEDALRHVSLDSVYFHMFEARIRLGKATNDFSYWMATALGKKELALKIAQLDPYTQTGERLRTRILELIERELASQR